MESVAQNRVDALTLDFDDLGRYLQDGKPFTGTLYLESDAGVLEEEQEVREGFKWGRQREFHIPGVMTLEWNAVKGEPHGSYRSFHSNGKLASDKTYEFGVCVQEQTYEEDGSPKDSWVITAKAADWATLQDRRRENASNPIYRR